MNYTKHNVYVSKYKISQDGIVSIPENAYWRVMMHLGEGNFIESSKTGGKIAIILSDDDKTFWPIISFLDDDEARELANEILDKLS